MNINDKKIMQKIKKNQRRKQSERDKTDLHKKWLIIIKCSNNNHYCINFKSLFNATTIQLAMQINNLSDYEVLRLVTNAFN